MSTSSHKIKVRAVDETAGAFAAIKNRAAATGAQIRSMMGGALAAAGAYLGFSSIKGGIDQLGHLSDIAQKTSTSVDELTKTATAMNVLGIQNASIDRLAKSFDYMAKTTGRSGMAGFYQTLEELGKIEDVASRGQQAMKIFGDAGMEFMPLISAAGTSAAAIKGVGAAMPGVAAAATAAAGETAKSIKGMSDAMPGVAVAATAAAGESAAAIGTIGNAADGVAYNAVEALQTVVNAMPAVPQAAADAGDAMSDAMGFASNQVKSIWLQGLGAICGWFDNEYVGGVREASLTAGNHLEYYTKVAVAKALTYWHKLQNGIKAISDTIMSFGGAVAEKFFGTGGSWSDVFAATSNAWDTAWKEYDDAAEELERREEERTERFARAFEDRQVAIEKFQGAYDAAAISINKRKGFDAAGVGFEAAMKTPTIKNELVMGGNEANRIAMLGPQLQNETKKQTALLSKIVENTKNTADNTKDLETNELEEFNG